MHIHKSSAETEKKDEFGMNEKEMIIKQKQQQKTTLHSSIENSS